MEKGGDVVETALRWKKITEERVAPGPDPGAPGANVPTLGDIDVFEEALACLARWPGVVRPPRGQAGSDGIRGRMIWEARLGRPVAHNHPVSVPLAQRAVTVTLPWVIMAQV